MIDHRDGIWDVRATLAVVGADVVIQRLEIVPSGRTSRGGIGRVVLNAVPLDRLRQIALGEPGVLPRQLGSVSLEEELAGLTQEELDHWGETTERDMADWSRAALRLPPTGEDAVVRRRPGRKRDLIALALFARDYVEFLAEDGGKRINHRLAEKWEPDQYKRDRKRSVARMRDRVESARQADLLTRPSSQGRPGGGLTERAKRILLREESERAAALDRRSLKRKSSNKDRGDG